MTGKIFAAALALLVTFGCSDPPTTSTSLNEATPAVETNAGAVKTVPYKGHGHWWSVVDALGCEGDPGNLFSLGAGEINVTHLGRSDYSFQNCWEFDPHAPIGITFVSQAGSVTGAHGDQLFWYGSAAMGSGVTFDLANLTYEMGPFWFTGGTGRFDGATGSFMATGSLAPDFATGTENWHGMVSSVGSIK